MTKYVTSKVSRCVAYHTDKNCVNLKKDVKEATPEQIAYHDLKPCDRCAGDGIETNPNQNWEYQRL